MISFVVDNHMDDDRVESALDSIRSVDPEYLIYEGVPPQEWGAVAEEIRRRFDEENFSDGKVDLFNQRLARRKKWNNLPEKKAGFETDDVVYLDAGNGWDVRFGYEADTVDEWVDLGRQELMRRALRNPEDVENSRQIILWGLHGTEGVEQTDLLFDQPEISVSKALEGLYGHPGFNEVDFGEYDFQEDVLDNYSSWEEIAKDHVEDTEEQMRYTSRNWMNKIPEDVEDSYAVVGLTHASEYGDNFRSALEKAGYETEVVETSEFGVKSFR